jgi:hypothetical protein
MENRGPLIYKIAKRLSRPARSSQLKALYLQDCETALAACAKRLI